MVPYQSPVGNVKIDASNALVRNPLGCFLLNGRSNYSGSSLKVMPGSGVYGTYFGGATTIALPDNVVVSASAPFTVAWSEYIDSGKAVLNRGSWRIKGAEGNPFYHIYGGTNTDYRDFTVREVFGVNSPNNTPDSIFRSIALSYWGTMGSGVASINGKTVAAAGNGTGLFTTTNTSVIGRGYDYTYGIIGHFYVFSSGMTQAELNELSRDPMQIWIPA
jgi:hypothetical protein